MEEKNYILTTEDYSQATEEVTLIAMEVMKDKKELKSVLDKAYRICERWKGIPIIGEVIVDFMEMIDLIRSYIHQEYTQLPIASILSCLATLIYLISPVDMIPDCIPIAGYLDDVGVIKFVIQAVQMDLNQYKQWKEYEANKKMMRYHEML